MVGGANYGRSTFNRATRSRRQPGSAFKPMVYAAALEHGYSPGVGAVEPRRASRRPEDPEWNPRNAGGEQADALTLRAALLESNNAAAADLQQQVGSRAVLRLAADAGLNGLPDVPSLALGTGLVSPLDLTAAYTMFPGGGQLARPRGIVSVLDADGDEVLTRPVERQRIIGEQSAFQMVTMLRDAIDRGTGSAVRTLGVRGPVGGKTGTTDEYRDAWFVGFSSSVVVGVWVGFDQPAPIGPRGVRRAHRAAHLGGLHEASRPGAAGRGVRDARRPRSGRACAMCRTFRPVQECSLSTRSNSRVATPFQLQLVDSPRHAEATGRCGRWKACCDRWAESWAESSIRLWALGSRLRASPAKPKA